MIQVNLNPQQEAALQYVAALGGSRAVVNLEGHLDPAQPATAEGFLRAHIDSILAHYVAAYEADRLVSVQSLGEVLVQLPEADRQELIEALIAKATARGIDTSRIEGGGTQP